MVDGFWVVGCYSDSAKAAFMTEFIHVINSLAPGGAERHLCRLLQCLVSAYPDDRHTVVTICELNERLQVPDGVRYLPGPGSRRLGLLIAIPRVLMVLLLRHQPCIVGWMYHGSWVAGMIHVLLFGHVRATLNIRHGGSLARKKIKRWMMRSLRWLSMRGIPFVFNSHVARGVHVEIGYRLDSSVVIPNGLNLHRHRQLALEDCPAGVEGPGRMIAFLGRNHRDKGADLLPAAMGPILGNHEDVRLVVAGTGTGLLEPLFKVESDRYGFDMSRILLLDHVENTAPILRRATVLFLSSRTEGFPNVALEAMALGVPVAYRSVGDLPLMLDGLIEGAETDQEIVAQCVQLLQMTQEDRHELSSLLVTRVEDEYDLGRTSQLHRNMWLGKGLSDG